MHKIVSACQCLSYSGKDQPVSPSGIVKSLFKAQSEEYFDPLRLSGVWKHLLISVSPHQPGGSCKPMDFRGWFTSEDVLLIILPRPF